MKKLCLMTLILLLLAAGCKSNEYVELGPPEFREPPETPLTMSLEDKLWQLFFVTPEAISGGRGDKSVTQDFVDNSYRTVGGIILFADNISSTEQVSSFLADMNACFETPVFLGVDEEGGKVSRLGSKGIITDNGNMRDIGDTGVPEEAAQVGARLGGELAALGFNLDFAPVADTITNPKNTEIGRRSFGTDAELVSSMVAAEVKAMQSAGISAVLKHFPGHGSTSVNSHNATSVSDRTLDELRAADMKPFKAGIDAGVDFVMVSHMSLPAVTGTDLPCSLSGEIISLLRDELNFDGIVITDALNMGAVSNLYSSGDAAVMAIEAGADMLLMPENPDEAYAALLSAVKEGRITESRIDESARRILEAKKKRGLLK